MNNRPKKKSKKWMILIVLLGIILGGFFLVVSKYEELLTPISTTPEEVNYTVEVGATASHVLEDLESQNLIRSALAARISMQLDSFDVSLKAGEFVIDKSWTFRQILEYMSNGNNITETTKRLTFVEGKWADDYAFLIQEELGIDKNEILTLWNNEEYLTYLIDKYEVLTSEIFEENTRVKLEGYLAPNTYEFFVDADAKQITERLVDQMNKIYLKYKEQFLVSELSTHEVINLSSVVQSEAKGFENMKLVSSVFLNRIAIGMRLEASATVCYAIEDASVWQVCESSIGVDSPYNTYQVDGLPIGPVSNPGEEAILAVLEPTESDYLFFISEMEGENAGTFHFAKTFQEHQKNVNEYLR